MKVYSLPCPSLAQARRVVALGCFDGIHPAHQALFSVTRQEASRLNATSAVFTFSDFLPQKGAPLSTLEERLTGMEKCGIEEVFLSPFAAVKGLSPEEFIEQVLKNRLGAISTVCGFNYRFGAGARGDGDTLSNAFPDAKQVPAVTLDGAPISSTRIRASLEAGEVEKAAALLGRPYAVTGQVTHGKGAGHLFGFPTANIAVGTLLPAYGVYETRVTVNEREYIALTDVGVRPTVEKQGEARIESFLLEYSGDLYGETVTVAFLRRLREEKQFDSLHALKMQIDKDVKSIVKK